MCQLLLIGKIAHVKLCITELGKSAQTLYEAITYDVEHDITRVKLTPITGRSHQLRVHLLHLGHPITGDKLYHPNALQSPLGRMALHAYYLSFQHPIRNHLVEIESNVPF